MARSRLPHCFGFSVKRKKTSRLIRVPLRSYLNEEVGIAQPHSKPNLLTDIDDIADPNFRTINSGNSPLIVAAKSSQPDIVLQLLQAHANANVEDNSGLTPLRCATEVGSFESMKHLLDFAAKPDDESLHVAARLTKTALVKVLLDHGASVNLPGIFTCDYRTPLGELCRRGNPLKDPAQMKNTLDLFSQAQPDLAKLSNNKSLVILALDNDRPFEMTNMLLKTISFLRKNLNADFNVFRDEDGSCFSLTMYVRRFRCRNPSSPNNQGRCCDHDICPAPALVRLLQEFGCRDRFWVDTAGANQPLGMCGPPAHVVEALERVKREREKQEQQVRLRAEETARQKAIQEDLDRAARAELRRERKRMALVEERRQADANEERRRFELQEETRQADALEERRKVAAVRAEENADKERRRIEFAEQQDRIRRSRSEKERHVRRTNEIEVAAMERKAKVTTGVLREKKMMIDSANQMMQQAQLSRVEGQGSGMILGEVEEVGRFLN